MIAPGIDSFLSDRRTGAGVLAGVSGIDLPTKHGSVKLKES